MKHDYDHAIEDFDQATRLNPKNADAYDNRGAAYFRRNDFDKAIADFDRAIQLNPSLRRHLPESWQRILQKKGISIPRQFMITTKPFA